MDKYDKYYESVRKKKKKEEEEELERWNRENPDKQIGEDRMPISQTTTVTGNSITTTGVERKSLLEEFLGGYITKGAMDTGVNVGNVAKTILGTAFDVADDAKDALFNMGETAIDAGATAIGNLLSDDKKEKVAEFVKRDLVGEYTSDFDIMSKLPGGIDLDRINNRYGITDETIQKDIERNSVLGEKSDALVQAGTQMLATGALQAAGLPWFLTTGVSSFGASAEEALKEDATIGEATVSGSIKAAADVFSELLTGGISFGSKTLLGDGVKETLTKNITNKALKTVAKYGLDMAGEGVEEIVAEAIGNAGKAVYKDDKTAWELVFNEDAFEQYLDSFIGGALISGGANLKKAVKSVKSGRDYDTGLSENEQKVLDAEVDKRVNKRQTQQAENKRKHEQEEAVKKAIEEHESEYGPASEGTKKLLTEKALQEFEGKELDLDSFKPTNKELKEIRERVDDDLRKGYIDISTIEETLMGDNINKIKELEDRKSKATKPEDIQAIEAELNQVKTSSYEQMKNILRDDHVLNETYKQRLLKDQDFVYEESGKDSEITKELAKSATKAKLGNDRRSHELFDFANNIANDLAKDGKLGVKFVNNEILKTMKGDENYAKLEQVDDVSKISGCVVTLKDGTENLLINVDSKDALNVVTGHETTHLFEGTTEYDSLSTIIEDFATENGIWNEYVENYTNRYKGIIDANTEEGKAKIKREVVAQLCGEYVLTDEQFVKNLSAKEPNIFKRVYENIKHMVKMATTGSAEERKLLQAKRMFEKAYREAGKSISSIERNTNATQYMISENMSDDERYLELKDKKISVAQVKSNETLDGQDWAGKSTQIIYDFIKKNRDSIGLEENYTHEDIDFEFQFGNARINKSLNETKRTGQDLNDFKDLLTNLNEVVKNAVLIEKHKEKMSENKSSNLEAVYVFLSAYQKGNVVTPVRFQVKELKGDGGRLYFAVTIEKSRVTVATSPEKGAVTTSTNFNISIPELVKNINPEAIDTLKYIPDEMLSKEQIVGKRRGVEKDKLKYGKGAAKFSISDSKGRELTKEQQEYFKESKARDENGAIKTVYHGTNRAGFTVFNRNQNWYTDNEEIAGTYTNKGGVYEGYLNIKNPLVIDVAGERWSRIDVDQVDPSIRELFEEYGVSTFEEDGAERTSTADIVGVVEDGIDDGIFSYDGVIFENIYDEGTYGNMPAGTVMSNVYVTFNSNQFKNVDNKKPTDDPDIRFSLSAPVEETKELIAVHNMRSEELSKTLDLGGLPMPSIAIIKAKTGHAEYGDVSLVFNKETIDPKFMRANKVYGGDAWTPTYPTIEYKANEKVADKISSLYYELAREHGYDIVRPMYNYAQDLEDTLNRNKGEAGILEDLADDTGMMQVYLLATGKGKVENIEKETVTELSEAEIEMNDYLINALGEDVIKSIKPGVRPPSLHRKEWFEQNGTKVETAYSNLLKEVYQFTDEEIDNVLQNTSRRDYQKMIRDACSYLEKGPRTVKTEIDYSATKEKIRETAGDGYNQWLKDLFSGAEEKTGIRNNVDVFTRSGNRRSWEALHWENNLENVVKVMKQEENGVGFFGGSGIFGVSAKEYGSIDEIRADSGRLERMDQEGYEEVKEALGQRFQEIATSIMDTTERNQFIAIDNAMECIVDAVRSSKTKSGILNSLKQYRHLNVTETTANDIVDLVKDIAAMPTEYFEAKPRRAVGLDEIAAVILPDNADSTLLSRLQEGGYNVVTYKAGDETDRAKKLNDQQDALFSLSNNDIAPVVGEYNQVLPAGSYEVYGRDVKQSSTLDDIAHVAEETATNGDDIAPVRAVDNDVWEADPTMFEETAEEPITDYDDTAVPMDKESMRLLTKNMKEVLGLNQTQRTILKDVIQNYSTGKITTPDDLYNAIADQFGVQSYEYKNEELQGVKKALRETKMLVSDELKDNITDYFKFRQQNFGKLRIANDGLPVDVLYEALSEVYPGHFPADIVNPADQLYRMEEVANMDATIKEEYVLPEEKIAEATDFIRESVSEYKRTQRLKAALRKEPSDKPLSRRELRKALIAGNEDFIIDAMDNAKNLPIALMNNTDTVRVSEMVFGRDKGKKINELVFQKAIDNEARSIYWQNKQRADIKALGIKPKSKMSAAVQKYGEGEYMNEYGDLVKYTDDDLAREFPKKEDQVKIRNAADFIRQKYDEYIDKANAVLTKQGFDPIPKIDNYMRHFEVLNDVFSKNGIPFNPQSMAEHNLPTDINGLTEFWSPQKQFFANALPRKGKRTTLDAIQGVDGYIGGIANLIYHTEDIQRGRALEDITRETYGEEHGWDNAENLPDDLKAERLEKIQNNHLSNYAAWVHEWTNNMAGKTNKFDRAVEATLGRRGLAFLDQARKQVGSNMIGFNLSSSMTNFIAPVQAASKTSKMALAKGTADTVKNIFKKDGFADKNAFLTSRMGTDMLTKTPWSKATDAGFMFMKGADWFTSNQIVRSKYHELIAKGRTEQQAHAEAGQFAARIMGDRSKGAQPALYNSKLIGLATQFQLEVNNQMYSMFYDTYHESKESAKGSALKTAAGMTFVLGQLAAYTHVFGQTFESIAGYNPTFDIVEIIKTALGWDDDDEEKTTTDRLKDAADMLADALPYVNLFTDGGRIPIASGIPNLIGVATGGTDQYGNDLTLKEEAKKAALLFSPTGANQIKKTYQGLKMFDKDLPVSGSYTNSGGLRFPVEDNLKNRIQAGLFGQWANENAREYFDGEHKPLKEKQIQEFKELDIPIADYWDIREDLADYKKNGPKIDYISELDLPISKKNLLANNVLNRKEDVDLTNYDDYGSYEEFDYAMKNPDQYPFVKAVGGIGSYEVYSKALNELHADKNENGKSISGSRKEKVIEYIDSLDADYGTKIILYKSEYSSDDTFNNDIIDYLNSRDDISYDEMKLLLEKLGFTVDENGNVGW